MYIDGTLSAEMLSVHNATKYVMQRYKINPVQKISLDLTKINLYVKRYQVSLCLVLPFPSPFAQFIANFSAAILKRDFYRQNG